MKNLKTISIIGIVISGLGIFGGLIAMFDLENGWLAALVIYGYFLFQSIYTLQRSSK